MLQEAHCLGTLGPDWYSIYTAARKLQGARLDQGGLLDSLKLLRKRRDQLVLDGATTNGKTELDGELRKTKVKLNQKARAIKEWFQTQGSLYSFIEQIQKQRAARKS